MSLRISGKGKHWIREMEVQKGAPPVLPCGLQDVLLELSPRTGIALLTNCLSYCGFPPEWTLSCGFSCKHFIGSCQEYK